MNVAVSVLSTLLSGTNEALYWARQFDYQGQPMAHQDLYLENVIYLEHLYVTSSRWLTQ